MNYRQYKCSVCGCHDVIGHFKMYDDGKLICRQCYITKLKEAKSMNEMTILQKKYHKQ